MLSVPFIIMLDDIILSVFLMIAMFLLYAECICAGYIDFIVMLSVIELSGFMLIVVLLLLC